MEGLAADLDVHGEIRADIEGRVNVDELEAAGILDLTAERAALERGEDELVRPAFEMPAAHVETEFLVVALLLARLVNVFEGLKRKDSGTDLAGLSVPGEFDLAFVLEEERAVFLRERFALVDEIALLRVGEFVGGRTTDGRG